MHVSVNSVCIEGLLVPLKYVFLSTIMAHFSPVGSHVGNQVNTFFVYILCIYSLPLLLNSQYGNA